MDPVVTGRVLGYALIHAPNQSGREALACEINACECNWGLPAGLVFLYVQCLIRVSMLYFPNLSVPRSTNPVRNPKGPTPTVSPNLSPRFLTVLEAYQRQDSDVQEVRRTPSDIKIKVPCTDSPPSFLIISISCFIETMVLVPSPSMSIEPGRRTINWTRQ